jgi:hypothetical protein
MISGSLFKAGKRRQRNFNRAMRYLYLTTLFLLIFSPETYSQATNCTLNVSELPPAPELVGFRMGMTKEQVKVRIPQVVFGKTDKLGVSKTTINPFFDPRIDQSTFAGVRSVSLDFLDDHLTSLWIGYDSSFAVTSVEQFVKRISESLHLPKAWVPWRSRGQQMSCGNFQLIVTMVADGPSFRILDLSADEALAARRDEQESAATETTEGPPEVIGDKSTRVYYTAGCQPSKEIAETDRVLFRNVEAADKAGFKAAKTCQ